MLIILRSGNMAPVAFQMENLVINDLEPLIIAGRLVLQLAKQLDDEGRSEEAQKLYLRAIKHGQALAKMRAELEIGGQERGLEPLTRRQIACPTRRP